MIHPGIGLAVSHRARRGSGIEKNLKMKSKQIALLGLLISTRSVTLSASFDCSKAKTTTEKLICSTPETSALDEKLSHAFKNAYGRAGDKVGVRQSQRDWLNEELKGCIDAACIKVTMAERITLLDEVASVGEPVARWTGHFVRYENRKVDSDKASISILGMTSGRLNIKGSAIWIGQNEGQVNFGEMQGVTNASPVGNEAQFDVEGCEAKLTLRGNDLIVENESGCGGLNVSFNGHYQRIK